LTPPWQNSGPGGARTGGATSTSLVGAGGSIDGQLPIDVAPQDGAGGAGGASSTILDAPVTGGAAGSVDSPLVATEAGSLGGTGGSGIGTDGAGGAAIDERAEAPAEDVPMGGAGGTFRDGSPDGDVRASGGAGGGGTGGRSTGGGAGGGAGGKGTGGSGGKGTGGSGTGGKGTGGSGTGGSGTGGSGTGGSGTGGSGTGGSGTGGSGTGGVTAPSSNLIVYYPCDQTSGPTLLDATTNHHDATLVTGTGGSGGYTFGTGPKAGLGNALDLVKTSAGYATVPPGILTGATEMTIATWVYVNSNAIWARVWDFGNSSTTGYMFLASQNAPDQKLRFAITKTTNNAEQTLTGTAALPATTWTHVAVVLGSSGGVLYVNGAPVAGPDTNVTLRPSDLGSMTNCYIGKSQWADPYFDGDIDEFRIYNRALSAAEILALYNYAGP
jgi:hypothetical protein